MVAENIYLTLNLEVNYRGVGSGDGLLRIIRTTLAWWVSRALVFRMPSIWIQTKKQILDVLMDSPSFCELPAADKSCMRIEYFLRTGKLCRNGIPWRKAAFAAIRRFSVRLMRRVHWRYARACSGAPIRHCQSFDNIAHRPCSGCRCCCGT